MKIILMRMLTNFTIHLPLVLVQPRVNALLKVLCFERHNVAAFLTWHAHFLLSSFGRLLQHFSFMGVKLLALDCFEHDSVLAGNLGQEPPACQVTGWVGDVHLELNLLIDDDRDDSRIGRALYRLQDRGRCQIRLYSGARLRLIFLIYYSVSHRIIKLLIF